MFKIGLILVGFVASSVASGILSESLLKSFANGDEKKDVIVEFSPVANSIFSSSVLQGLSGNDRQNKIVSLLQERTSAMQAPVINALTSFGVKSEDITPFWIANKFAIKGASLGPLQALSALSGVAPFTIREPFKAKMFSDADVSRSVRQTTGDKPQWGVAKINAPAVWETGNTGKGVVVGIIDTGVNVNHIALKDNYRGGDNSWLDAFGEFSTPTDGQGHGTHCAGSILGTTNGIGVAPGANWIACRGLDSKGSGDEKSLTKCGEFMACPSGNSSGTCTGMPHIVSNSWGGAMGGQTWFNSVIDTWRKLGIIPIFAIGNSGYFGCLSAGSPGDQPNLISVGSTDEDDKASYFSSRGPNRQLKQKPELSAPGGEIVSADFNNTTGYKTLSGTSMATPHVAGAAALILSANPEAKFDDIKTMLEKSAVQPKLGFSDLYKVCTIPFPRLSYPNNLYGAGRIDVAKALGISV